MTARLRTVKKYPLISPNSKDFQTFPKIQIIVMEGNKAYNPFALDFQCFFLLAKCNEVNGLAYKVG